VVFFVWGQISPPAIKIQEGRNSNLYYWGQVFTR
jgi:hypothetical protein